MNYENPTFPEPPKSLWERFNPRHLALADEVAKQSRQKNDLGGLMANAQMGYSTDDQEKMELQGRLQEMTAQFVEATKDLDDSAYQQAAAEFTQKVGGQAPQRQQAQLNNPTLAQGAFGLLAAALDPSHAAESVSQVFDYQLKDQKQRQGLNDQQYADDVRNQQQQIGAAETRMNVEERKLGKAQASQDRQANMTRQIISDIQDRLNKIDANEKGAIEKAFSMYQSANRADEKELAGHRLQVLLGKSSDLDLRALAPSNEEIAGAANSLRAEGGRYATQEWETALRNEAVFGEVDDSRFGELENQRLAIAKKYGIDPESLRVTPTARTVAAQKLDLANKQFGFLKTKTAEDFKLKWAALKVAQQRANDYGKAVANGFALGTVRNQISEGNLRMRGLEFTARAMAKSGKVELEAIQKDVSRLAEIAAKFPTEANQKALESKRIELNQLLQSVATDLGIDPSEAMSNPIGTIQRVIEELDNEEDKQKAAAEGATAFNPFEGQIGNAGKGTTGAKVVPESKPSSNPKRRPRTRKPKQTGIVLPPGAKFIDKP